MPAKKVHANFLKVPVVYFFEDYPGFANQNKENVEEKEESIDEVGSIVK